jgi:broad specificity phosphatase PhoE
MRTSSMPAEASRFCLLRHGQSEANVRGLIASSLAVAQEAFGLTAAGRAQVRETVVVARSAGVLPLGCRVVSSPLLRARESAVIAADILGTAVHVDTRLAERGFGDLELSSDDHYERVWGRDRADPAHDNWGVESTEAVLARVTALLRDLMASDARETFLLCTHGDVASIALCAAHGMSLSRHREVGAMANGEVRRLDGEALAGLSGFPRE